MSTAEHTASMSLDELIAVIERGLDGDERAARDAGDETTKWYLSAEYNLLEEPGSPVAIGPWGAGIIPEGEHLARHDPSRVLADVESKREVIRAYKGAALSLSVSAPGTPPHDLMTGATTPW